MAKKLLGTGSVFRNITTYPKCTLFPCSRYHSGTINNRCCYYCEKKESCKDPCLNNPDKCGKCVIPSAEEGGQPCGD